MKSLFSCSLVALLAIPATVSAQTLTEAEMATKRQLAAHIGVDPDQYTLSELARLNCRLESAENEAERQRLLEQPLDFAPLPQDESAAAHAQLAQSLGVDASDYTAAQISMLKSMVEDDDCNVGDPASFAKWGAHMTENSARAKMQLAQSLGASPTEYTLAELLEMRFGDD